MSTSRVANDEDAGGCAFAKRSTGAGIAPFMEQALAMRKNCAETVSLLAQPVPFPYFHVINFMLSVNLAIAAYALIFQETFVTIPLFFVVCLVLQGLKECAVALSDPFGGDAVDFEVDVDVVADYPPHAATVSDQLEVSGDPPQAIICGIMEHIEEAGVHSGDSSCTIPTNTLSKSVVRQIEENARRLAERLCVRGLMNVQMAVKDDTIYMIEVNPRASRTVPYVAKSRGIPFAGRNSSYSFSLSAFPSGVPAIE